MAAEEPVFLACFSQVFPRVFADRGEHREPRLALVVLALAQEAAVDERCDPLEDVDSELAVRIGDPLGGVDRATAHEDGKPRMEPAFLVGEKVIAPRDCLAERALPRGHVCASAGRELEPALEAAKEGGRRQHLAPGRGELDPEGEPVEPLANLGDDRRALVRELEVGPDGAGPLHEQHHAIGLGQRRHGILALGCDA
jgi:hypothetical protein